MYSSSLQDPILTHVQSFQEYALAWPFFFTVPDLFIDSGSDCSWGLPNDDHRHLELRHLLR